MNVVRPIKIEDSWRFAYGDPITPDLVAVARLGGRSSYETYLAFDEVTYGPVVVKVVRPDQVSDDGSLRGLRREVHALATLNHPVMVRGLRHLLGGDRPHVVLEQIDGPRLSSLIRRHGRLPKQQYLPLGIELAGALHYLRGLGWTHLDVKPSNIIMGTPARLIDLSVARPVAEAAALTAEIGTDAYMAPEQCAPGRRGHPGPESDVWGLGATLFEAVAGYRPFPRGTSNAYDLERRYPQLSQTPGDLPADTPPEVARIVRAALEPDPGDRPLPHEVAAALEPVLARQPRARFAGFKVR